MFLVILFITTLVILITCAIVLDMNKSKNEKKIEKMMMITTFLHPFLGLCVITNSIIISYIMPVEIKETKAELVEYSKDNYFKIIHNDVHILVKDEETENEIHFPLNDNNKIINNNIDVPYLEIKENVYPDYFDWLFMKN